MTADQVRKYRYTGPQPHAPRQSDERLVAESSPWARVISYDASGNQTGWTYPGSGTRTATLARRTLPSRGS
ncbi:hypothetical protein [Sorangium sp. So ce1024]|uniref:hypothetical protein n=1 Tax=unclassified Sorangium TaxID=2621164 RepID=UPI003F0D4276